jgi:hypothetical protein
VILTNLSFSAQVGKKHFYRSYKIKAQWLMVVCSWYSDGQVIVHKT